MKKILLGFIAIGLLTFVGCEKEEDETTETSSEDSSIEYGEGATDIDGNTYKSVIIGEQEWMAKNLTTSRYSDGTSIPNVTYGTQWQNFLTGAWCNYNNSSTNDATYGKLYNWHAVETEKLCPTGWHVPTDAEWTVLYNYLGVDVYSGRGRTVKTTSGWNAWLDGTSGGGTDNYGWGGLPGGYRTSGSSFANVGNQGKWWSSSQAISLNDAWIRYLDYSSGGMGRTGSGKEDGMSVRCLRD